MPLVKSIGKGLWEQRSRLETRITRIIFDFKASNIILLHGFIKKTEKISLKELEVAQARLKKLELRKDSHYGLS